jgi:hypothetical protein
LSPANLKTLFEHMGWPIPGDKSSMEKLDGELKGGTFILSAKLDDDQIAKLKLKSPDGSFDSGAEVDLEFEKIGTFECHRFELPNRKGKGFRRELRFKATFPAKCQDALTNLESYMARTDNARGTLKVRYLPEPPKQGEIKLDEAQGELEIGGVVATEEQREATAAIPIETGTLASARVMGAKRGRLAKEAN